MSKKQGGGGKASSGGHSQQQASDWNTEDVLQAVVVADSFNSRFAPVTMEAPRALLPLCNMPLLDYTLECLVSANIQEIFVFCCSHADQIKEFIDTSRWINRQGVSIQCIVQQECLSIGDALREIDHLSIIKNDFILVYGDLVSNTKLKPVLDLHKKRKEEDKLTVMTMVMKAASPEHRTRSLERDSLIAVDASTQRLLAFQPQKSTHYKKFQLPASVLKDNSKVQLRYDLFDCHICICSPMIPFLFTDNFDFNDIYDLVHGILYDEEILGNKIFIHELNNEYAARVDNLRAYDAISKDVIHRWTFPMVPDYSSDPSDSYKYGRNNIYLDENVILARSCSVLEDTIIGKNTTVGEGSVITRSTIGRNCLIGSGVSIDGAYIWDNVTIADGCRIENALVCSNVALRSNVSIGSGSVIAYNVVVGPDVSLPPNTKLTMFDEEGNCLEEHEYERDQLGAEGRGRVFTIDPENFEKEELEHLFWGHPINIPKLSAGSGEDAEDDSDSDSSLLDDDEVMGGMETGEEIFLREVKESVSGVLSSDRSVDVDNVVVEINGSKHAYNIEARDLSSLIARVVAEYLTENFPTTPHAVFKKLLYAKDSVLYKLLKHYIRTPHDQVTALEAIIDVFAQGECEQSRPFFANIVLGLYDKEVLEEEAIKQWYAKAEENEVKKSIRSSNSVKEFITWLDEAEEASEDDEDDEDDE